MGIAQRMRTVVEGEIGIPVVLNCHAGEGRQNAERFHPGLPAFGINAIVGQFARTGDVEPVELAGEAYAAFVKMGDFGGNQLFLDACQGGGNLLNHLGIGVYHQRFGGRVAIPIPEQFTGAGEGQQLIIVQVTGLGAQTPSILHRLRHIAWKRGLHPLTAARTVLDFGAMLGYFQPHRRNIKDLSPSIVADCHPIQAAGTVRTHPDGMDFDLIRLLHHHQAVTQMSDLTTIGFAAFLA